MVPLNDSIQWVTKNIIMKKQQWQKQRQNIKKNNNKNEYQNVPTN